MKRKITSFVLLLAMLVSIVAVLPIASAAAGTTFKGADVTLTDGILLNFYVEADDALGIDNAEKKDGKYVVTMPVAAKNMGDDVTANFKAGATVVGSHTYSVKQYAEGILAGDDYDAKAKALVSAMLNYGAAAQNYFGYETDALVGTPVTDTTALKAAVVPEVEVDDEARIFIGASLILEGTMTLRFYFAGTADSATVDGEAAEINEATDYCYVDVKITPNNIDKVYEVAVADTTVKYSVLNYLKRNADNAALSEMVASIYAYSLAAEEYVKTPLDYLQDEDLLIYEYPLETVEFVNSTIGYSNDTPGRYAIPYKENKATFIEITDTTFDSVTMTIREGHSDPWICYTFLTEVPTYDNEAVKFAEGYSNCRFAWEKDITVDIPADAKYLYFYAASSTTDYMPETLVFTKGETTLENIQDTTLDEYNFPMANLVPDLSVIAYWDGNIFKKDDSSENVPDAAVAFIDITHCAFDYVSLTIDQNTAKKQVGWSFVTKLPERGEVVSYATDYEGTFLWASGGNNAKCTNIAIPEDAKYLVIYYMDSYDDAKQFAPAAITFHDTKK